MFEPTITMNQSMMPKQNISAIEGGTHHDSHSSDFSYKKRRRQRRGRNKTYTSCYNSHRANKFQFPYSVQSQHYNFGLLVPYYSNNTERCVALDCEMVGVCPGGTRSVLARASVVDFHGNCLLDAYVRVEERVTDYRTSVSGIRPSDLTSSHAVDFGTCRQKVQRLLQGKILVGHGLQNDLEVMNLTHPWSHTRDTSLYEPFMKVGRYGTRCPQRLCVLAKAVLGRSIQQDGEGHDSLVDAQTAMDLYKTVREHWDHAVMESERRNFIMPSYSAF